MEPTAMHSDPPTASPRWTGSAWLAAVVALLGLLPVAWDVPVVILDPEEAHTPWAAAFFPGLSWADARGLQPNGYCHGCSVDAWTVAALFQVLPRTVATWRIVGALYVALLAAGGFRILRDLVGRGAGWAWIALLIVAPATLAQQLWTSWGGHVQGVALALFAVSLGVGHRSARRWAAAGLGMAFALFYTLGAAPLAAGTAAWLAVHRRFRALAAFGLAAALAAPFWAPFLPLDPHALVGLRDHMARYDDGLGVGQILAGLVSPQTLALLFGPRLPAAAPWAGTLVGGLAGVAVALVAWRAPRARVLSWMLLAWLGGYLASSIHVDPSSGEVREARFAVHAVVLAWMHLAVALHHAAARRRTRGLALAVALVVGGAGVAARVAGVGRAAPLSAPFVQDVVDLPAFLVKLVPRQIAIIDRATCVEGEPLCARWQELRAGFEAWDAQDPDSPVLPSPDASRDRQDGLATRLVRSCAMTGRREAPPACASVPDWYLVALGARFRTPHRQVPRAWPPVNTDAPTDRPTRTLQVHTIGRGLGALFGPMAPPPPCEATPWEAAAYLDGVGEGLPQRWHVDVDATLTALGTTCDPTPRTGRDR